MNTSAQRAAIYARVSSHRQQKQATIESQLAELRERARQDGVRLLEEHIVIDEGHSGSYLASEILCAKGSLTWSMFTLPIALLADMPIRQF